jgi:hypothetical protein
MDCLKKRADYATIEKKYDEFDEKYYVSLFSNRIINFDVFFFFHRPALTKF